MSSKTIVTLAVVALLLAGCTAEKARALRNGAVQFKSEAHAAVRLINETTALENAPPPRTRAAADVEFADTMLAVVETTEITDQVVEFALDPYSVDADEETSSAQRRLVASLYEQYSAFGDAFTDLEQGFLFSAGAVKAAAPTARRLTAQLLVFADIWRKHPPRFIQRRAALLVQIEDAASDESTSVEEKRSRLIALKEQWTNLRDEELVAQRAVVEQCLKAASIGCEIQRMIDEFDRASLEDIQNFVAFALQQAGELTGADLSTLTERSATLFNEIQNDPVWRESIDIALNLAGGRNPASPNTPDAGPQVEPVPSSPDSEPDSNVPGED